MWSKGPERKVELSDPVGILSRGRRRYQASGESPRFCYPMATSGGGNLPVIPNISSPMQMPLISPRMRSSEAYGSFYFFTAKDALGDVDLKTESKKAKSKTFSEEFEATRWQGGSRCMFDP